MSSSFLILHFLYCIFFCSKNSSFISLSSNVRRELSILRSVMENGQSSSTIKYIRIAEANMMDIITSTLFHTVSMEYWTCRKDDFASGHWLWALNLFVGRFNTTSSSWAGSIFPFLELSGLMGF